MATLRFRTAFIIALLTATACQPEPLALELTGDEVIFHALLSAGAEQAVVTMLHAPSPGNTDGRVAPVRNATVEIRQAGTTFTLLPAPDAACYRMFGFAPGPDEQPCYVGAVPGGVRVGATYELNVRLSDGRVITGSTTVPQQPVLVEPAAGSTLPARGYRSQADTPPVRMSWQALPAGSRAEVMLPPAVAVCATHVHEGPGNLQRRTVTGRTDALFVPVVDCTGAPAPSHLAAEALLVVYDINYTRYVEVTQREGKSIFVPQASSGLQGALGVFGSVAVARRPVTLELR